MMTRARYLRHVVVAGLMVFGFLSWTSVAQAFDPAVNPASDYAGPAAPAACFVDPSATVCVNAAVYQLDRSRAALGEPAYQLPAHFPSLSAAEQAFVLTNLDRVLYGLAPIPGITAQLDGFAAAAAAQDEYPATSGDLEDATDYPSFGQEVANMPFAYEQMMFQDSGNTWQDRQAVLASLPSGEGATAMGAAGAIDTSGAPIFTLMLVQQTSYQPDYTYTWAQAQAAGAGRNTYDPGGPADGYTPGGPDTYRDPSVNPAQDYKGRNKPAACSRDPRGTVCVNSAVYQLDKARAALKEPPYALPANFPRLSAPEQAFILSNLDRILYAQPPMPGLDAELDTDAGDNDVNDDDPYPTGVLANGSSSANFFAGPPNMPYAYLGWMYQDAEEQWGHRQDTLYVFFPGAGPLLMGANAGTDPSGHPAWGELYVQGPTSYQPTYVYTWAQAQADRAGTNDYDPGTPADNYTPKPKPKVKVRIRITSSRVKGSTITVRFTKPSTLAVQCALTHGTARGFSRARYARCSSPKVYRHQRRGQYRFIVRAGSVSASVKLTVRVGR